MSATRFPQVQVAGFLALLIGCGGATETPPPPPPPPVPTSLSIEAGNNQTAPAGSAVEVPPAVVVRDGQGRPMAGVQVQFAVSEGGGSVDGPAQTSDAAGMARVTRWVLGQTGNQRLSAQVGTIAPAVFQATLTPGTETIEVALPPGGGAHEITTIDHPYRGFKLTVPAGALANGATWRFRIVTPPVAPTLPAGYQLSGPVLEVETEQPRSTGLLTLDIPITTPAGRGVLIAFRDPVRGVMEILPAVARTATMIRVVTTHLRGDLLIGRRPAGASAHSGNLPIFAPIGQLFPISFLLPVPDVAPVLNPTTDRWPVLENGSAALPNGHGPAIAAFEALARLSGGPPPGTFIKGLEEPGFYGDAGALAALSIGLRRLAADVGAAIQLNVLLRTQPKAQRDELVRQVLGANLAVSGVTPVALTTATDGQSAFANLSSAIGSTLALMKSSMPQPVTLTYDPLAGFAPLSVKPTVDAPATGTDGVTPLPSVILGIDKLGDLLGDLQRLPGLPPKDRAALNAAMAAQAGFPPINLELRTLLSGLWTAVNNDQLVVRSPATTVQIRGPGGSVLVNWLDGIEVARSSTNVIGLGAAPLIQSQPTGQVTPAFVALGQLVGTLKQLTSRLIDVVWAPFEITPGSVTLDDDNEVALEVTVPLPPASGFRVQWQWGDGTTSDNLGLTTGTHTYAAVDNYTVIATLFSHPDGVVLAADTIQVRNGQIPYWQITIFQDLDEFLDGETPNAALTDFFDAVFRLVATPQAGLIAIEDVGGGKTVLRLRVLPSSIWGPARCCPPPLPALPGEFRQPLGEQPSITYPVGPFFSGFGVTRWSQTTTDLNSGTLSAQIVLGTEPRVIDNVGTQIGPKDLLRTGATRNGTTMTGTITAYAWFQGPDGINPNDPPTTYRLSFTAVRLK